MKILRLGLPLMFSLAAVLRAADPEPNPPTEYARAVQSYVDGATEQLRVIRADVDAQVGPTPSDETKQRYATVYAKLGRCDKLVAELKKAGPADFDRIKLRFELNRADMIKSIERAHKG